MHHLTNATLDTPAAGVRAAVPIVFGYLPIGFAAGVVGVAAGLSPAEVALLSLLVFAGSAQFVFADLVGTSSVALITTIFLINFRHFLYSAALSRKIKRLPLAKRIAIGAQLTDETFSLASILCRPQQTMAGGLLALNMTSYTAWFIGNVSGALVSAQISLTNLGADFLLIAMFAALLMLTIVVGEERRLTLVIVAVISAVLMVSFELLFTHPLNILLAAGVASTVGAVIGGDKQSKLEQDVA